MDNSQEKIRSFFSKYVSESVLKKISSINEDDLQLGGKKKVVTVFFSDLVGFTDLSERLKPEDLLNILSVYFEKMTSAILERQGTIDKFMGDAIMAFWNAPFDIPGHENFACEAALLQKMVLNLVSDKIKEMGIQANIDMRIGINTGEVIVGNFGCSKRYDYTVLGDPVNLASRLEGINKQYGTRIIIGENTYNGIDKKRFITRELDTIVVKGKLLPVRIYELVDFNYGTNQLALIARMKLYEKALDYYRKGNFMGAKDLFQKVGDNPSDVFIKRCDEFAKTLKDEQWDGVYRFKVK